MSNDLDNQLEIKRLLKIKDFSFETDDNFYWHLRLKGAISEICLPFCHELIKSKSLDLNKITTNLSMSYIAQVNFIHKNKKFYIQLNIDEVVSNPSLSKWKFTIRHEKDFSFDFNYLDNFLMYLKSLE